MFHVVFCILLLVILTSVGEERANLSAIVYLYLCGFCWRDFLFLWVLGVGYVISLWHSLGLPYNYYIKPQIENSSVVWCKTSHSNINKINQ